MSALLNHRQLAAARRPSKYHGLTQFNFAPTGTLIELECWIEHEPAEKQTFDEPGHPASAVLCIAEIGGKDISECLSEPTVDEIEDAFLEWGCDDGY